MNENNELSIYSFANYCLKKSNYRNTGVNLLRKVVYDDMEIAKDLYVTYGLDIFSREEWISVFQSIRVIMILIFYIIGAGCYMKAK